MKYTFLTLITLGWMSCSGPAADNNAVSVLTSDDEETLRNLKTVLWPKAYGEQDTVLLDQILHADFQLIDDNGDTYSKEDELEYIANYGPSYSSFEFSVERLDLFDNGTAMVSGVGTMKGVDDEGAYVTTYRSSNTLVKVDGQWKAINSHVSGVKEDRIPNAPEE
ncbi:MAG: hypothetical protein Tsb0034_24160 [Ekhidna sp.]